MAELLKVVIKEYGKFYDKRATAILLDRIAKANALIKKKSRELRGELEVKNDKDWRQ